MRIERWTGAAGVTRRVVFIPGTEDWLGVTGNPFSARADLEVMLGETPDAARLVALPPLRRACVLVLPLLSPSLAAASALVAALAYADRDVASLLLPAGASSEAGHMVRVRRPAPPPTSMPSPKPRISMPTTATSSPDSPLLDAYSLAVADVAERLGPAVCAVTTDGRGLGSGVVISPDGLVVTVQVPLASFSRG